MVNSFDATDFLNNYEDVVEAIYGMIHDGEFLRYPQNNKNEFLLVREKRKLIHDELKNKLDQFSFDPEKSALKQRISKHTNNVTYFKIINPIVAHIKISFLEVTGRLISGGNQYSVVSNMINNIEFGDDGIQNLIDTQLVAPLLEDLEKHHKIELEKDEDHKMSVKMYVNKHQKDCRLPCEQILKDKVDFTKECLSQRIPLGGYYAPYISEAAAADSWGILGDLFIQKNNCIAGLGNPCNKIDNCNIFTDANDNPTPAHLIISFKFHEIGVCNKKPILYLRNEDKCYYSFVKTNEIRSARSMVPLILKTKPDIKANILAKCLRNNVTLPPELKKREMVEEEEGA